MSNIDSRVIDVLRQKATEKYDSLNERQRFEVDVLAERWLLTGTLVNYENQRDLAIKYLMCHESA